MASSPLKQTAWRAHKFGGTSVGSAERLIAVSRLIRSFDQTTHHAVIVSAISGVTDQLIAATDAAAKSGNAWKEPFEKLKTLHLSTWSELCTQEKIAPTLRAWVEAALAQETQDLHDLLHAVSLARTASPQQQELISGYGELWSSRFLTALLGSEWWDARELLVIEEGELGVLIDWPESERRVKAKLASRTDHGVVVVTGFIASTKAGVPTTLKRNGSDYSSTIFANLLDARDVTIWKEVDGIMSANPKIVPAAQVLDEISYAEASELAYFGAKVLHPSTMGPAIRKKIPIWIRNSFEPSKPGTKIHEKAVSKHTVKGFTTIDHVALINVEGTGMLGVPGVASRLFSCLREVGVSVILISQASSEHSICFAVPENQANIAASAVRKSFAAEIGEGLIQEVETILGVSVLAMVGDRMVDQKGVAARFFRDLARSDVSIRAIAQGSSERNISVVIRREDVPRALRAVHAGFYLSKQVMPVAIIGPGTIGVTFARQVNEQWARLSDNHSVELKLMAIADSKEMLLSRQALSWDFDQVAWRQMPGKQPVSLEELARHLQSEGLPNPVIIDCTANVEVAAFYAKFFEAGIHVVTPNKKAGSGALSLYQEIKRTAERRGRKFFYEATVGAGLPIITTLQDLILTGDRIRKIEGMLSGTLAYVFSEFKVGVPFSKVVLDAKAKGYTEPDPRDDLSGKDVARKLVILAREAGFSLEVDEIPVESLVSAKLANLSVDEFLKRLPEEDAAWAARIEKAEKSGSSLRYVGELEWNDAKKTIIASVSLREVPGNSVMARASGSDNVFLFTTDRYLSQPLVIQGPGAGPAVTAAGVFADLLRLMSQTGGA